MRFALRNFSSVLHAIERMAEMNIQGALRKNAHHALEETRHRFFSQRTPDGKHWAPLKNQRPKRKALVKTGQLKNSFLIHLRHNAFSVGSPLHYAPLHQFGTKTVPARPFLGLHHDHIQTLIKDILSDLNPTRSS